MSYYEPCRETYSAPSALYALGSMAQGVISGSYVLLKPQIISIPLVSVKSVGPKIMAPGTGNLYVYIAYLPTYVNAYVNIAGINVQLSAGLNKIPIPGGVEVGPITLINNNDEEVAVALWAFLAGLD